MGKQKTDGSRSQMIENNFPLGHPSLEAGNRLDTKGMSNAQIFKVTRPRASTIFRLDRLDNIAATFSISTVCQLTVDQNLPNVSIYSL